MADIARDDDTIEIALPPRFQMGERVISRSVVRNDGTYGGKDIGALLVNRGDAIGSEVMTLARAIQESVYGRFGIRLEPEPVVV